MASYSEAVTGTKTNGAKSDTIVPWSLNNSDQPGMTLVTSPLVGINFVSWSLAIKSALEAKEKLGFIDGSIKEPTDEAEYKKWKPVDSMVKAWVRNSIEKNLAETFMFCRTSRELWVQIEERYGVKYGPKFYQLQQELASLKQGNDSVTIYYNKIHRYWDELHRLRPTPRCVCAKCICNLNKKLNEIEADTKLVQFLMGLNQTFEVIKSQILALDPLPSANKAFGLVVNVETEKWINSNHGSNLIEGSVMMARGNNRNETFKRAEERRNEKMAKFCDHCQQNGHTRDSCFKIVGYPEWFKDLKEQRKKNGKKTPYANMVSETPIDLPKEKGTYDYASVMSALQELTKIVREKGEEQHVNFVNLGEFAGNLGKNNYSLYTDTAWVVDTGASSHMCFNKELFINIKILEQPIPVHLPDGSTQRVKHTGTVDQKTKQTLVEGKLMDNLYILKHEPDIACSSIECARSVNLLAAKGSEHNRNKNMHNITLWHQRLGHAPIDVLKRIDAINVNVDTDDVLNICDICKSEEETGDVTSMTTFMQNYPTVENAEAIQRTDNEVEPVQTTLTEVGTQETAIEEDLSEEDESTGNLEAEQESDNAYFLFCWAVVFGP
ncbi:uncharacterized protein G2W53_022286 [Senna tora]|uniref:Retrotransposon Copia-like N-terminal domain-containing protein n=1 Tax=Senna tora TaxID=362788 RepID=A0A834TL98_9FABA|nr:uncharacterized protein G2W53_022286 [Senna tora]